MSDELPEGWAATTVGACLEFRYGKGLPEKTRRAGTVPVYGSNGVVGRHDAAFTTGATIVVGRKGSVGEVHLSPTPCWPIDTTYFIDSFGPFEPQLLAHQLRSLDLAQQETSTAIPGLSRDDAYAREVVVPPLSEQHRIVEKVEALLEQVDKAKGRLDRVPLILKRFRQAVLAAACSGELTREWRAAHPDAVAPRLPEVVHEGRRGRRGANLSGEGALLIDEELPELPDTWNYARLDRLTEPDTVITYGIVLPGPEIAGGVPYVRGQDVEDGWLRTDALRHTTKEIASKHGRSSLRAGDVLLCVIRNLRVAVVPDGLDGGNITQGMVRIRTSPAVVLRDFVASYLMSPLAQGWMKRRYFGMDMPRINVEDARAVPVALPPLDEQAEIVRHVEQLFALADTIEQRVQAATARAEKLPQAILSKAFAGELVPTEADLARAEGRTYETAEELLARVRQESEDRDSVSGVRQSLKTNGQGRRAKKRRVG